eukprot:Filipodium_phascolosomae@DN2491_c0_g1_i1.p1
MHYLLAPLNCCDNKTKEADIILTDGYMNKEEDEGTLYKAAPQVQQEVKARRIPTKDQIVKADVRQKTLQFASTAVDGRLCWVVDPITGSKAFGSYTVDKQLKTLTFALTKDDTVDIHLKDIIRLQDVNNSVVVATYSSMLKDLSEEDKQHFISVIFDVGDAQATSNSAINFIDSDLSADDGVKYFSILAEHAAGIGDHALLETQKKDH